MTDFYDDLETREPSQREADILSRLPAHIANAKAKAPGWAAHLADFDPSDITSLDTLARLPLLRKSDLVELQRTTPPFGDLTTLAPASFSRIFMSPGPIFEPEGSGHDWWRSARALYAAGVRKGDIVHNSFAYQLTPGAFILEAGARALGCAVMPAGVANLDMQLEAIERLKPSIYMGTPDFLKVLLDRADAAGRDVSSLTKAFVSGAALPASLRQEMKERGVSVLQAYATAEIGIIAYESKAMDGLIVDEGVLVEIVRPGTGDPVLDGDVGEVVVTSFNPDYPLIRFATGDLSAVLPGASACGRSNTRLRGWLGRADQATKVKGMFVHPAQINGVAKKYPQLGRLRLVVTRAGARDAMTLLAESRNHSHGLAKEISEALHEATKLRGHVELVPDGSLPNDGKVIADERDYD